MISVAEAYQVISKQTTDFGIEKIPLLQSCNRILATDVTADRDFPPYNRVTMDGIAINTANFASGQQKFFIKTIGAAGSPVQILQNKEHCIEVMTGAVLPLNADAVVPYEQCSIKDGFATVNADEIKAFQNIHRQGTDEKKGSVLIEKFIRISPAHISVMATVGMSEISVYKLPRIAICSTGDELVAVTKTPLPHQIRQSNIYFLAADLAKENIVASLHHLPDEKEQMKRQLNEILRSHDAIFLSGAVSKGRFDFLPEVLNELGMTTLFHQVAQRPGKPFLFGSLNKKTIFGFPGNPVSTFVCYHLYGKQWLEKCLQQERKKISAKLLQPLPALTSLSHHLLVRLIYNNGGCGAEPIFSSTSGDIPALIKADGIISLPAGKKNFETGEVFDVVLCR